MLAVMRFNHRFALHAVRAFDSWCTVLRQSGLPVPPEVDEFLRVCRSEVSEAQPGSQIASGDDHPDGVSMPPLLLTYAQAETALQCSHSQVKRLVSAGDLATVRVGGLVRIRTTDLAAYVESLAVVPRTEQPSQPRSLAAVAT